MTRTAPTAAPLLVAILTVVVAGCGLGDLPTRPPVPTASPVPTPSPVPTATALPTPQPTPTPVPAPTPLIYTVKAGDRLLTIAKRFKTTGRSIAYWNRAKYPSLDPDSPKYDPNRIEIGWMLTITPGVTLDQPPDASPGSAGSPSPVPTVVLGPVPSPPADGSGLLLSHGSRQSNVVILTLDFDAPAPGAGTIVQWLIDQHVPATVFVTGQLLQADATASSVVATMASHPDLFQIGDGTWTQADLSGLSASAIADQLKRAETAIGAATGTSTKPFFRPPDGAQNAAVRSAAAAAGFPYAVLWDIDPDDGTPESSGGPTTSEIVTVVASRLQGGSIVHLHLGGESTLAALPGIVDAIEAARLVPVTLDRALGR
jgi:peptidoglycan/xylan/chitin deacetylase (PgdA/CDA1 family)